MAWKDKTRCGRGPHPGRGSGTPDARRTTNFARGSRSARNRIDECRLCRFPTDQRALQTKLAAADLGSRLAFRRAGTPVFLHTPWSHGFASIARSLIRISHRNTRRLDLADAQRVGFGRYAQHRHPASFQNVLRRQNHRQFGRTDGFARRVTSASPMSDPSQAYATDCTSSSFHRSQVVRRWP